MSKHTKQHYIPQCYLREFVDPKTPQGQEPYVWVFNRGENKGHKKAPSNIFVETDLYTIKLRGNNKDYAIEETLSDLESKYAVIFRSKIKKFLPLTEEEHVMLCAFVCAMMQRTLRHKDNLELFYDELIKHAEEMELAHNTGPKQSRVLKEYKENTHKYGMIQLLPEVTTSLMEMSLAFLVADTGAKFVTSDDPCNLFNPDLQWQKFRSPGLAQKHVQVTLPLSPEILLCLSWSNLRGYIHWRKERVQEANRLVVGHCYKYFVSSNAKPKWIWFRRYPLDLLFIFKILGHKITEIRLWIINRYKYRYVRKR